MAVVFDNLIKRIREINSYRNGVLISDLHPALNNCKSELSISGKELEFTFVPNVGYENKLKLGYIHNNLIFKSKQDMIVLEEFFINKNSFPRRTAQSGYIYSFGFSKRNEYFFKLVIPLKKGIVFRFQLESQFVTVNNKKFKFKNYSDNDGNYFLIIDSDFKFKFDDFQHSVYSIKNAIGYITGYLAGDTAYFFAFEEIDCERSKHFYKYSMSNTIISSYTPIHSNSSAYIDDRELIKKYTNDPLLRALNESEFSNLSQKIYDSIDFESAIILLLESSDASLLFMPGGYCIVLEMLTDLIKPDKKVRVAPMSPSTSKKIRLECSNIIEKYKDELEEGGYDLLLDKIEKLNLAPNISKLSAPFNFLKIELTERDYEILKARNKFLHGEIPELKKTGDDSHIIHNRDLYYCSVKLYSLINMLILKWIGFDGRIVNYPKINENYTKIFLDEDHHKLI